MRNINRGKADGGVCCRLRALALGWDYGPQSRTGPMSEREGRAWPLAVQCARITNFIQHVCHGLFRLLHVGSGITNGIVPTCLLRSTSALCAKNESPRPRTTNYDFSEQHSQESTMRCPWFDVPCPALPCPGRRHAQTCANVFCMLVAGRVYGLRYLYLLVPSSVCFEFRVPSSEFRVLSSDF